MGDLLINYTPNRQSIGDALLAMFRFWRTLFWMSIWFGGLMSLVDITTVDWRDGAAITTWLMIHLIQGFGFGTAMALLFRYLLIPWQARILLKKNPAVLGPSSLRVDGEGLNFATPNTSASFVWTDLRGYKDMSNALVVATRGAGYYAVPTTGVALSDLDALRKLLAERVPKLGS